MNTIWKMWYHAFLAASNVSPPQWKFYYCLFVCFCNFVISYYSIASHIASTACFREFRPVWRGISENLCDDQADDAFYNFIDIYHRRCLILISYKGCPADWAAEQLFLVLFALSHTNMHLALFSFVIATLSVQQAVSLLDDKCAASINGMYNASSKTYFYWNV